MQPPSRTDWPLIAALFAAGLLAAGQFAKLSFTLSELSAAMDRDIGQVAWLVSVLGLVGLLGGVMAGGVVAGLGARRVLLWSLALGAAVSAVQMLMPGLAVFGATRIVEGFSQLGIVVAGPPLMAGAATDRDRAMVMAIWAAFFGVSFAIAAIAIPPLARLGGPPLVFAIHAGLMAVLIVPLARRLAPQARAAVTLDPVAAHLRIYRTPRLAAPGLGFVFYTFIFVALVTLLPVATGQLWLGAALPVAGLAGSLLAGPVLSRWSPHRVGIAGFVCVVLGASGLLAGVPHLIVPLFVLMGMIPAASFAMIPHLNTSMADRALATGCIAQMGNVGTTLGTPVFALALGAGGLPLLYGTTALSAACGCITVMAMQRFVRATGPIPG